MASETRKRRRAVEKGYLMEERKKLELQRQKQGRIAECVAKRKVYWKDYVHNTVPKKVQIISLFIPPAWYHEPFAKMFQVLDNKVDHIRTKYNILLGHQKRRAMFHDWVISQLKWTYRWGTLMVPLWRLRMSIRSFGTFTTTKLIDKNKFRMTIRSIWKKGKDVSEWTF